MHHISTLDHTARVYTQCDRCAYAGLVSMQCRSTAHMRRLTDACMHRGRRRRPRSRRPRRRRPRSRRPRGLRPRSKRRRSAPPLPPHHLSESQRAHDPQPQRQNLILTPSPPPGPDPDLYPDRSSDNDTWPEPEPDQSPNPTRALHTEPRPSLRHSASPLTPSRPCAAVCTARGRHQARASHLRGVVRRQEHRVPEAQHQGNDPACSIS